MRVLVEGLVHPARGPATGRRSASMSINRRGTTPLRAKCAARGRPASNAARRPRATACRRRVPAPRADAAGRLKAACRRGGSPRRAACRRRGRAGAAGRGSPRRAACRRRNPSAPLWQALPDKAARCRGTARPATDRGSLIHIPRIFRGRSPAVCLGQPPARPFRPGAARSTGRGNPDPRTIRGMNGAKRYRPGRPEDPSRGRGVPCLRRRPGNVNDTPGGARRRGGDGGGAGRGERRGGGRRRAGRAAGRGPAPGGASGGAGAGVKRGPSASLPPPAAATAGAA